MLLLATLPLFPRYSLDTSILIAVLVGVLILAALTETFGWVFVGLVVPGYLASVLVIHPEAGATVIAEAFLTYGLAALLSNVLSRTGAWSPFFGRDRFFIVVLASVLVRAVCEGWLLPHLSASLDERLGTTFTLDRTLHSIGLVLVPLTANAFWKLGLRRGSFQVFVPVLLTWALLHFVLLPYTNLSFSSLELTYEDVAQNFLASPKAYILLLCTALLAARFNLLYGWDFNGILVPALIALTWLSPSKAAMTVVEVLVLVIGTRLLLSLPGVRTLNLEGPRKTVVVFALGFLLKMCVGFALGGRVPGLKVTDLFGFGYLVPTLLAVKILQKQVVARVVFATVHTSLAGFALGSVLGFGLSLIEPKTASALPTDARASAPTLGLTRSPLGVMAYARATSRESATDDLPLRRKRGELRRYGQLMRAVDAWLVDGSEGGLRNLRELALPLGLELRPLPRATPQHPQRYALIERENHGPKVGWDTALLAPGEPGPVLEVPRPVSEAPTAEGAALVCEAIRCRAIVVSGVDTHQSGLPQGDVLEEIETPLQVANVAMERSERIVLRADGAVSPGHPVLHPAAQQPQAGASLQALWPALTRASARPPDPGVGWHDGPSSILRVHPSDLHALVAHSASAPAPLSEGVLNALLVSPHPIVGLARPLPQPTDAELWVLREEIAAPLLGTGDASQPADPQLRARWASAMAQLLELEVREVKGPAGRGWAVTDHEGSRGRLGAGLIVSPQGAPLAIEVPAPVPESGTLPFSTEAWRSTRARVLLWGEPALPLGPDQPSPATPGLFRTAYQAFHEAAHHGLPAASGLVLQVRGFSDRPSVADDVLVDLDGPVLEASERPAVVASLFSRGGGLGWLAKLVRYHDASVELAGLADASPQQSFSRTFGGARLATVWLSRQLRSAYVAPRWNDEGLRLAGLAGREAEPAAQTGTVPEGVDEAPLEPARITAGLRAPSQPASRALRGRFEQLAARVERALSEQSLHDLRSVAGASRAGAISGSVRAHRSALQGLSYLELEVREGKSALRGFYFLQQTRSPLPRVELPLGAAELTAQLEAGLRGRAPIVVSGELVGGELATAVGGAQGSGTARESGR